MSGFKICFFCGKLILEKISKEHVVPEFLLNEAKIKIDKITTSGYSKEYSRIKVPSHLICNTGFGSRYENAIKDFLKKPTQLFKEIESQELVGNIQYGPSDGLATVFATWLSKIYYGLFYYDFLYGSEELKQRASSIVNDYNFSLIQDSYKKGHGFCLPSSLFAMKTFDKSFDLRTLIVPSAILLKIRNFAYVLLVGDGNLVTNYIDRKSLNQYKKDLYQEEQKNFKLKKRFPSYLEFFSELLAVRMLIPKTPRFLASSNEIVNLSFSTMSRNPQKRYAIKKKEVGTLKKILFQKLVSSG